MVAAGALALLVATTPASAASRETNGIGTATVRLGDQRIEATLWRTADGGYQATIPAGHGPLGQTTKVVGGSRPASGEATATATATAPQLLAGCPTGYLCWYRDSNATGEMAWILAPYRFDDLRQWPCGTCSLGNWNDEMTSWVNASTYRGYRWYFDIDEGGESHDMAALNHVQNVYPRENDQMSSFM